VSMNKLSLFEEALLLDEQRDQRDVETYLQAIELVDAVADAYSNLLLGILARESRLKDHSEALD
jgi:hypothetical protein